MTDPITINRMLWDERAAIHARDATGFYRLDGLRAGEDVLVPIEAAELGDIAGKRVLHLQCHIGCDSLCLARRGADVTGLDFSEVAIEAARRLAQETGLYARFVLGPVERAPELVPGPFDLVFTSWGTIAWLPEVDSWAKAIAAVLRPGGELYFADAHPAFLAFEEIGGKFALTYDIDTPRDRPLEFVEATTYTGDPTVMVNQAARNWIHSLASIFSALISAGMTITMFREHEVLPWKGMPSLAAAAPGLWRWPDGHPRFPLAFSLRARKGG